MTFGGTFFFWWGQTKFENDLGKILGNCPYHKRMNEVHKLSTKLLSCIKCPFTSTEEDDFKKHQHFPEDVSIVKEYQTTQTEI